MNFRISAPYVFLILLFCGLVVFGRASFFSFLDWDDPTYVTQNSRVVSADKDAWLDVLNPFSALNGEKKEFLPLLESIYRVLYQVGGGSPVPFHLASILFHVLASFFFFLLLKSLSLKDAPSLFGSLVFLVHPFHVESVAWVSGLKDPLVACFIFLGLLSYARTQKLGDRFWWGSFLALLLAFLSKGVALVFVPLALLVDIGFQKRTLRKSLPLIWPHICLSMLFSVWILVIAISNQVVKAPLEGSPWFTFFTMTEVFSQYLAKMILPIELSAHYKPIPIESFWSQRFLVSVCTLSAGAFLAFRFRKKKEVFFPLFWFLICFLPVSNIIPLSTQMADRYMYIAIGGYCFFLAKIFVDRDRVGWGKGVLITFLLVLYGSMSFLRVGVWENDRGLWKDVTQKAPHNVMAWNNYGAAMMKDGDVERASHVFENLTHVAAWKKEAWNNLGRSKLLLFRKHGNPSDLRVAERSLREAIQNDQNYVEALNNLGIVWWERGLLERNPLFLVRSKRVFEKALNMDPAYGPAKRNLEVLNIQMDILNRKKGVQK